MQKALEQMNIQLHKVLSDLVGATGMKIVRAILRGERDPERLVQYCHALCKRPREDFVAALTGQYREDHLFALRQAVELFDVYHEKLHALDEKTQAYMRQLDGPAPRTPPPAKAKASRVQRRKNQPHFDLRSELVRLCGVDLTRIDGIDAITAQTLITEQGIDMSVFPSEKHFASHLGLCPNNQITGGKIRKRKTRRVQSRAAKALRLAAQSLHKNDSALGAFYRRINGRHGPAKAITATAHKLAKLVYRMLKHGEQYLRKGQEQYEAQFQKQKLKNLIKQANRMGCEILRMETGELLS
jgi:transposase